MNELTAERMFTTKEVAEQLHTSTKVILENSRKYLPNKIIETAKRHIGVKAKLQFFWIVQK